MNGIQNSFIKVFLFISFQVLMSYLICFSQAADSIDQEESHSEKIVKTPMPGRLTKVNVQKGQEVKVGDLLYIIEAMKMEMMVHSPFAGQIQDVLFRANDIVGGNCTIINFTPPIVERNDRNQAQKGENKDISPIILASYTTDSPPSGSSHLPRAIPTGAVPTESSSSESFVIKPPGVEPMQKERIFRAPFARKLNDVFKELSDDIDSDSALKRSSDENDTRGPLADSRDHLIALFSYASSSPPSGLPPPGSPSKGSPAKKISRNPHDPYPERGKEESTLHPKSMSPMMAIMDSQVVSNNSYLTAIKWACGSIAMCLLMLTSKLISSYRLRRSQLIIFNQIKNFHFVDRTPNRFMTKQRGSNMNRVIIPRWKAG